MDITFSVQTTPQSRTQWLEVAARAERDRYARLYCADHPGSGVSPVPALAAAAAVTSNIALGALVMNVGVHEPFDLAADVAGLDLLSDGRAVLGLGAGHTPVEWAQVGRAYPSAGDRIGQLLEVVDVVTRLLAGQQVRHEGRYLRLDASDGLSEPPHGVIPLLLGGNGPRLLEHAAAHADIIGLSGLGRTLADGHRHEIAWAPWQIEQRIELVRSRIPAGRQPVLEALVQRVEITDDAEGVVSAMFADLDVDARDLLESPYLLIGTPDEIAARIRVNQDRYGVSAYAVRAPAMDDVALIRAALQPDC